MHTVDPKKKKKSRSHSAIPNPTKYMCSKNWSSKSNNAFRCWRVPALSSGRSPKPRPGQEEPVRESGTGSWWAKAEGHWELLLYRNLLTERDEKCELTGVSYSSTQGHPPPSSNAQNFLNQSGEPQTFEMLLAWWRDRLSLAGIQDFTVRVMAVLKW